MSNSGMFNAPAPPVDTNLDLHKEVILEEVYTQKLLDNFNATNLQIILPDDVVVKDKNHKKK